MGLFSRLPAGAKAVKPRLYAAIDRATSEYLSAPNLGQNMDVVSTINSAIDPRYASNKACKRIALRIGTRNQRVQYISLLLLENLVRSCGESFHAELAKSPLFSELTRMGDRSVWCATEIQRLVLALIQEWAYEVQFPQFSAAYSKLKQRGMPFEPRGTLPTALLQPYPGMPPVDTLNQQHTANGAPGSPQSPSRPGRQHQQRPPSRGAANLGPDLLRPGKTPSELRSDIDAARGTIVLLNEVLNDIEKDRSWPTVKEEYCIEVASACQAIKDRLAGLLGSTDIAAGGDESLVAAALEMNDDAQRALDRRSMLIDVADGRRAPPPPTSSSTPSSPVAAAVAGSGNGKGGDAVVFDTTIDAPPSSAPPATNEPPPLLDLLSDLDWTPAPTANGTGDESSKATVDPFLPPPPMIPPPSNNPFAAAPVSPNIAWQPPASEQQQQQPVEGDVGGSNGGSGVASSSLSPKAGVSSEGGGKEEESNPFLSDDAFAAIASTSSTASHGPTTTDSNTTSTAAVVNQSVPPPPPPVSIPTTTPSVVVQPATTPSGNPFATEIPPVVQQPTVLPPPRPVVDHQVQQQRPPALVVPSTGAAGMPHYSPGPFTAPPAYDTTAAAATTPQFPFAFTPSIPPTQQQQQYPPPAQQYPMTTTGAMHYQHQQAGAGFSGGGLMTPQYGGPGMYTPSGSEFRPQTTFPAQYGGVNKMSDAFGDLVRLAPEKEEAPPPPKGVPMRQSSVASTASLQQRSPSAAAASGGDGVSAFDAFDQLANGR